MKELPRDLHGSSIRTDKQDCQCLTEFKELAAMFTEDGILTVTMPKTEPKQKVTKAIEVS